MKTGNHTDTSMPLRVADVRDLADGIRGFTLAQPDGAALPEFTAGSHIKVQTPSGFVRKYSLCSNPFQLETYCIAVKREDGGQGGSLSMHQQLKVGDTLPTSAPDNAFPMAENAKAHLFIAGGIGITPMLAMIQSLEHEGLGVPWKLIYLSRDAAYTAFLDDLKAYGRRVTVHHDYGDPANSFDLWPALEKPTIGQHVYCCGPRPLMEAVRDMTGHWSAKQVHFESFAEGGEVKPDDKPFTVQLASSGKSFEVPVGRSILATLREHGLDTPSSCESGTCGTCRTRLLEGEVDHRDMVLMPEEMDTQIMICVSRAKSDRLVIDL
jgi:phthalate 4,5-dioxygenase reductase component